MTGYITKGIGGFYYVKTSEGIVECKPRGIFRKQKITPVAGDVVTLETENGAAVIADIAPRRNIFVRPPMANLDVLFLVASTTQPTPAPSCWINSRPSRWTRASSPSSSAPKATSPRREFLRSAYERSTLPFIRIDYATGEGLDDIRHWINGRLCAFCGNSGVGKSTLLNALLPDVERQTAAISQRLGRGRHTTREVTIFEAFGAASPTPRASPASRPAGRASSRKKIWNTPSRSSGLTSARVSSPAAPTAPRRAAPSAPPSRKASSPRPATTATALCTMRSRM